MTPAPSETPAPTTAPSAGTPFGEGMLAFDSEEEALAYLRSLAGGEQGDLPLGDDPGIMPIGEVDTKVDPGYFRFTLYTANEESVREGAEYKDYDALKEAQNVTYPVDEGDWDGPDSGDVQGTINTLGSYPKIEGCTLSSIRVNGTNIYHLGNYDVKGTNYVHFTAVDTQGRMTTVVLTNTDPDQYSTAPFEVRYVPEEYDITYEVYVGSEPAEDSGAFSKATVFGQRAPQKTVNQWFGTDVTIPAGYVAQVYIGNTAEFDSHYRSEYEKFPTEEGYGNYALGWPVTYHRLSDNRTIEIDSTSGPGFYSLTGTYESGAPYSAQGAQTVRVVLRQRTEDEITFDPDLWMGSTEVNRTGAPLYENVVRATSNGEPTSTSNDDGSYNFTWSFTTTNTFNDNIHFELRSMSINGKNLNIPFINNAGVTASEQTVLPSGAVVTLSVTATTGNGGIVRTYTITVTGAKRNITITGGSLNNDANNYQEVVIGELLGVDLQMWKSENSNNQNYAWRDVPAGTSLRAQDTQWADFMYGQSGSSGGFTGNIRFKLQEGYEWANGDIYGADSTGQHNVRFAEKTITTPAGGQNFAESGGTQITGPDGEGWYYTTLASQGTIGVLDIQAQAMQYMVYYWDGDTTGIELNKGIEIDQVTGMPEFDNGELEIENKQIDANHGDYYSIGSATGAYGGGGTHDSIVIPGASPEAAAARPPEFQGWVVTNASGNAWRYTDGHFTGETTTERSEYYILQPGDEVGLRAINDEAQILDDGSRIYAIYLTALWSTPADPYRYFVTFNYTDEEGTPHERVDATVTRTAGGEKDSPQPFADGDGHNFETQAGQYYVAMRDSYFDLTGLDGLSVVFDPDTIQSVEGGGITSDSWKWYKYDTTKNGSGSGEAHDPYKWTNVADGDEVDVWFISTLGQLTIGKEVDDLFPTDTDPADDVRDSADFKFDVEFTLPADNPDTTMGDETEYFGTGTYSVQYTIDGGEPQEMELTKGTADRTYTGTLTLKNGQKATFDLPAGTTYTVKEQDYKPADGDVDFKLTGINNNGTETITDESQLANGITDEEITATSAKSAQFTNAPTGVAIEKTQAGGDFEGDDIMHVGSGETVTYTITVWNYDVTPSDGFTVEDVIPDPEGGSGRRLLRVHEDSLGDGGELSDLKDGADTGQDGGQHYGGKVTWNNLSIDPGHKQDLTFQVSTPIVLEEQTYTNSATVTWDSDLSATSNEVTMTVYEDWLRIGKIAYDTDGRTLIAPNQEFTFTLELTLPDEPEGLTIDEEYAYVGRRALNYGDDMDVAAKERGEIKMEGNANTKTGTFTLQAGQAITIYGIAPGIKYKVTEDDTTDYTNTGMQPRTGTEIGTDGYGTISDASQDWVYFTNTRQSGGLTVSKILGGSYGETDKDWTFTVKLDDETINGEFGDMTFTAGVATFSLKGGDSKTATGLPSGVGYTVKEEADDNYTCDKTDGVTGTIPAEGDPAEAAFTNTRRTGDLTVTKTVAGPGDTTKNWNFTVTLDETISGTFGDTTFTNGVATFTLHHDETKSITDLPAGVGYTVTETEANADGYTTEYNGQTGTIPADGNAEITVTNTRQTGSLVVSKIVTGTLGEQDKEWTFTVTLSDTAINGAYGGMTFTNGVATFTLKSGEKMTAIGLPSGITYTVTEAEANADGYLTTPSGANGTIPNGGEVEAHFINENPAPLTGALTITKVVDGGGDEAASKTFTFTVTGNGSKTLDKQLPVGTYTVTEDRDGAAMKGYDLNVTGEGEVTIAADTTTSVTVTNTYTSTTGNLTVTKTVTGSGDTTKDWHFTVTLSDTTISGTYGGMTFTNGVAEFTLKHGQSATATGLPEGTTYTVTEAEADQDGYTTTYNGQTGTIVADVTAGVTVVNDKTNEPEETPRPGETPGPGTSPEPSTSPEPDTTPEPGSTPGPGTTSEPWYTPEPGTTPGPSARPVQPGGPSEPTAPETGDENMPALWMALVAGSVLALAAVAIVRRRKSRL